MATNPMQRRARNSFLIGFLIALIIMAIVVGLLLVKMRSINDAKEALEAKQKKVLVAALDLESGKTLSLDEDFIIETVQTSVAKDQVISADDFEFKDENGDIVVKYKDDGSEKKKDMVLKVDVPSGTIVTKDMIIESDEQTENTERLMEYNMIVLPSKLKNNDYIDIRISLPNGQDFIVLSKKKVLGTTTKGLWLKMSELEIELMNSAIVESYTLIGSKLYATQYYEPGLQEKSIPTYIPNRSVVDLINNDPNIIETAKAEYTSKIYAFSEYRTQYFDAMLAETEANKGSLVSSGNAAEIESVSAARQEFVDSLEGTEEIGYER